LTGSDVVTGVPVCLLETLNGRGAIHVIFRTYDRSCEKTSTFAYDGWELPGALWDEPRMSALLGEHTTIAVSGTAQNQGRFYDRFEHVIYLRVPLEVLLDRVRCRTNNPYGKTAEQQADITRYVAEVEPLIRRTASLELDGLLAISVLADRVEDCLRS
jgi:hypothetical protein